MLNRLRRTVAGTVLALAFSLLSSAAVPSGDGEERIVTFDELHLTLALPPLEGLAETGRVDEQRKGHWRGKLGKSKVTITFVVFPWNFTEPGDVTEMIVDNMRGDRKDLDIRDSRIHQGNFGHASFASVVEASIRHSTKGDILGRQYILGSTLAGKGYAVHVECVPEPDEAGARVLLEFLEKGITYGGDRRVEAWTNEEILERWLRDAPEGTHEDFQKALKKKKSAAKAIVRTKYYVIFTNSSSGKKFGQKMDKNYEAIRKVFPFEDVPGRRLMPVFLFRTPDQYYDYYVKVAKTTKEAAARSKGHAWKDYYATWYEAPGDPVHIHEQTHQIFSNRLRFGGGGSWFQEGVAEYIESSKNDRNVISGQVKKGRHKPLVEFVQLPSLLYSSNEDRTSGGSEAGDHYKQAALLIEFLRESKFGKAGFEAFLRRMGKVPRGDLRSIEEVFQEIYGKDVAEVDELFQAYCKKR